MEIKIIEETKKKIVLDIDGEDHTLMNLIKEELKRDKNVKIVSYTEKHPLKKTIRLLLETNGEEPKKTIINAIKKVKKDIDSFDAAFTKAK